MCKVLDPPISTMPLTRPLGSEGLELSILGAYGTPGAINQIYQIYRINQLLCGLVCEGG